MANPVKGFVVTMEEDINSEHAEKIRQAIHLIEGVASVDAVEANLDDHINRIQIRINMEEKLWRALHPDPDQK
jgi:divalent metal cation (Fe/Co/Zn/Cd) transporter